MSPYFVEVPDTLKSVSFIEMDSKRFPTRVGGDMPSFYMIQRLLRASLTGATVHSGLKYVTFSHNTAGDRLLGLSEQQIANAIAIAAVSDASFAVVRAKPLSQWKGLASAQSALGSVNTLFLARRGVDGPKGSIKPMNKNGSSGRTRTYNPPVISRMLCH